MRQAPTGLLFGLRRGLCATKGGGVKSLEDKKIDVADAMTVIDEANEHMACAWSSEALGDLDANLEEAEGTLIRALAYIRELRGS